MNDTAPVKGYPALGLVGKYKITKVDGTLVDPQAIYFVLRLDTDPHARIAMERYAMSIQQENPQLAHDLRSLITKLENGESPETGQISQIKSEMFLDDEARQTYRQLNEILAEMKQRDIEDENLLEHGQNRINVYTCDVCHKPIITKDVDEGVTPMFLSCWATAGCPGKMISAMYRVSQGLLPDYEWYKPASLEGMEAYTRDHVEHGGLLLRPVGSIAGPWEHSV